jgi:hypothetical protein
MHSLETIIHAISTDIPEFRARGLNIQGRQRAAGEDADPGYGRARAYSCDRAVRFSRAVASRRMGPRIPMAGRRSALSGCAAASIDGQTAPRTIVTSFRNPQKCRRFGIRRAQARPRRAFRIWTTIVALRVD